MAFENNPPVDQVVLPEGAAQTAGSGATVIGGALPVELQNGYLFGIVWYSVPLSINSFKYTYLCLNKVSEQIEFGWVDIAGVIHAQQQVGSAFADNAIAASTAVYGTGSTAAGHITLNANAGTVTMNDPLTGVVDSTMNASGGKGWLTSADTSIDKFIGATGSGTLPQAFTYKMDYRLSYDRVVDLRLDITFTVATTAANPQITIPSFPTRILPDASPNALVPRDILQLIPTALCGAALNTNGTISTLMPVGVTRVLTSFRYTVGKP